MKLIQFSFKKEAVWILVFSLAPAVLGILTMLVIDLIMLLR